MAHQAEHRSGWDQCLRGCCWRFLVLRPDRDGGVLALLQLCRHARVHANIYDTSAQYCVSANHGSIYGFSRIDNGLKLMTSVKLAYLQDVTKHHFHINVGPTQLPAVYTCLCFAQPAPTSDHLPF